MGLIVAVVDKRGFLVRPTYSRSGKKRSHGKSSHRDWWFPKYANNGGLQPISVTFRLSAKYAGKRIKLKVVAV